MRNRSYKDSRRQALFFKISKKSKKLRRDSDKIVYYQSAIRKKSNNPFNRYEIDRILYDEKIKPVIESGIPYKKLQTRKQLADYIHKKENSEYQESLLEHQSQLDYEDVYGKIPKNNEIKQKSKKQQVLETITQTIQDISETQRQIIPKRAY